MPNMRNKMRKMERVRLMLMPSIAGVVRVGVDEAVWVSSGTGGAAGGVTNVGEAVPIGGDVAGGCEAGSGVSKGVGDA